MATPETAGLAALALGQSQSHRGPAAYGDRRRRNHTISGSDSRRHQHGRHRGAWPPRAETSTGASAAATSSCRSTQSVALRRLFGLSAAEADRATGDFDSLSFAQSIAQSQSATTVASQAMAQAHDQAILALDDESLRGRLARRTWAETGAQVASLVRQSSGAWRRVAGETWPIRRVRDIRTTGAAVIVSRLVRSTAAHSVSIVWRGVPPSG